MTTQEAVDVAVAAELRDRARTLEAREWVRGTPVHPDESCLMNDNINGIVMPGMSWAANWALTHFLWDSGLLDEESGHGSMWFNDVVAVDKADVIATCEKAAAWWEETGDLS